MVLGLADGSDHVVETYGVHIVQTECSVKR